METKNQNIDLTHENLPNDSDEHTKALRVEKTMIISFIIIGAIFNLLYSHTGKNSRNERFAIFGSIYGSG